MAYSTGMMRKRITILTPEAMTVGKYGRGSSGQTYKSVATVWAAVDWAKGMRTMNAGAIDVYGLVMVRMRWTDIITMRCRIVYEGQTYQILPETFHGDKQQNTIQFNAQAVINE